mgnify:CR=1 FL=1
MSAPNFLNFCKQNIAQNDVDVNTHAETTEKDSAVEQKRLDYEKIINQIIDYVDVCVNTNNYGYTVASLISQ